MRSRTFGRSRITMSQVSSLGPSAYLGADMRSIIPPCDGIPQDDKNAMFLLDTRTMSFRV